MLMKPCPRCRKMMAYGPPYCAECRPIVEAETAAVRERNAQRKAQQYNRKRDPKYATFYRSKAWRTLSRSFLQSAGYKCQAHLSVECKGLAVEAHHVQPIQTPEGWERRLDWSNLEAVCGVCHNLRHPEKLQRQTPAGVIDMRFIHSAQSSEPDDPRGG